MEQSKAMRFYNWTNEDFSHKWDSVEYTFRAGESQMVQDYLANHFAKHLAQREINKKNLPMNDRKYQEFFNKCLSGEELSSETSLKLEMEIEKANQKVEKVEEKRFCEFCDSKGVRHLKDCPTLNKEKEEDNFEGK
ncbi:MAG: hypothetical protein OEV44_01085 [Spirochaetota bacterium]|nr:hypothetical protein [Spirochaetota bacterium]